MIGGRQIAGEQTYGRGLEGLVAGETAICDIDGRAGRLWYRGYAIEDLAARASFEEVSYLLLFGELPDRASLERWQQRLAESRALPEALVEAVSGVPAEAPLMDAYRTAVLLAASGEEGWQEDAEGRVAGILGRTAALAALLIRRRLGRSVVTDGGGGYARALLRESLGEEAPAESGRAFEVSLIVQAEHGLHAAALAALTVASAGAGLEQAVAAGIAALGGPLHGGANRVLCELLEQFADAEEARAWARQRLAEKYRFPGFGHRVYRTHDPRGRVLEPFVRAELERAGMVRLWEVFEAVRHEVETALGPKGIYANVDAFTGLLYRALGLPSDAFTIPFCVAIQTGWLAHCLEYLPDGVPIEPECAYAGA